MFKSPSSVQVLYFKLFKSGRDMYAQWVEPTDDDLRAAVASMLGVEEGKLKILSSTSEAGSSTGDGMTSVLRAITVRYQVIGGAGETERGEAKIMGKLSPRGAAMSRSWDSMRLCEREAEFYGRIRVRLDGAAAELGEPPLPFPEVYRCGEGAKVLLMEDLKASGFRLNDAGDESRESIQYT